MRRLIAALIVCAALFAGVTSASATLIKPRNADVRVDGTSGCTMSTAVDSTLRVALMTPLSPTGQCTYLRMNAYGYSGEHRLISRSLPPAYKAVLTSAITGTICYVEFEWYDYLGHYKALRLYVATGKYILLASH